MNKDIKVSIDTLRKTKGIGSKTLDRIIEQHEIDNDIKSFKSEYIPNDQYKIDKDVNLWQGDCLELMSHIPDKSVDMILADLPYGTTACSWDEIIPFEPLWSHYKRIIKDNGAIVLFGSEPFSTKLRMSNLDWYKYDWIWDKVNLFTGTLLCQTQPLLNYETISIFGKRKTIYNPQKTKGTPYRMTRNTRGVGEQVDDTLIRTKTENKGERFPNRILKFKGWRKPSYHPTQKPVDLLEYLVKTYTNKGMLVLDNTMGSGSTGVACKKLKRKFIGIELDEKYFDIAKDRIEEVGQDEQDRQHS